MNLFKVQEQTTKTSAGLLALRLIAGIAFILHGWMKIQHPMSWAPPGGPVSIPAFFQLLAAVSEFCGGIAWVLGIVTPLASFGIFCTMLVAVYFHMIVFKDPFVNMTGGSSYEPALVFLGVALVIFCAGPGKFSLDNMLFGSRKSGRGT